MRHFHAPLLLIFMTCGQVFCQTQVTVLGSVHFPTKNVNADSIYHILQALKPDIILMESDSTNFYEDFTFRHLYDENEYIAIVRYKMKNPSVHLRPIEFEGRNNYRKSIGLYAEAGPVWQKLNQLNNEKRFSKNEQKIWDEFAILDSIAESYKVCSLKSINSGDVDRPINLLINAKYVKVKQIVDNNPLFDESKLINAKGDTIRLREYFALWANFEGNMRNRAIVDNAMKQIRLNVGKKIVVITGFYHRPFMLEQFKKNGITTREFYQ